MDKNQWTAPVRAGMRLLPQFRSKIPDEYGLEWQHSTISEMRTEVRPAGRTIWEIAALTTADHVHLMIALYALEETLGPILNHIVGVPVSYRVRWEPDATRAYPAVWQAMADYRCIAYDAIVIGEQRIPFSFWNASKV